MYAHVVLESTYKILGPSVGVLERVVGLVDDGRHALRIVAFPLQQQQQTANARAGVRMVKWREGEVVVTYSGGGVEVVRM
jgi:xanthine/CO dehydrogenase XdhC/CoxF family maturation factor